MQRNDWVIVIEWPTKNTHFFSQRAAELRKWAPISNDLLYVGRSVRVCGDMSTNMNEYLACDRAVRATI